MPCLMQTEDAEKMCVSRRPAMKVEAPWCGRLYAVPVPSGLGVLQGVRTFGLTPHPGGLGHTSPYRAASRLTRPIYQAKSGHAPTSALVTLAGGVAGGADASSPSCTSAASSGRCGAAVLSCERLSPSRLDSGGAPLSTDSSSCVGGRGALATVLGGLNGGAMGAELDVTELDGVVTLPASAPAPAAPCSTPPSPVVGGAVRLSGTEDAGTAGGGPGAATGCSSTGAYSGGACAAGGGARASCGGGAS